MACDDYKKTKSPLKMAEKAKKIYEEFIQTEAPQEVSGHGAGDGTGKDEAAAVVANKGESHWWQNTLYHG